METNHKFSRTKSEALLSGRIFDDRGHRMTPSHARRRGIKYRYYISAALLQGRPKQAGTVSRIPAQEVEALVIKAVRDRLNAPTEIKDALFIRNHVTRVEVQPDQLVIELTDAIGVGSKRQRMSRQVIEVPWRKTPAPGAARFSCLNPKHLKTSVLSVPRTAHSWSHRLRGGADGSMSSSPIRLRIPRASHTAKVAVCEG